MISIAYIMVRLSFAGINPQKEILIKGPTSHSAVATQSFAVHLLSHQTVLSTTAWSLPAVLA